jgi:hypothetical protein
MQVTVDIPDDLAVQLIPAGQDPARAVLEDALVQAYREDRISGHQLQQALGIETRYQLDGFLKARGVWIEYTPEQMAADKKLMEEFLAERAQRSASNERTARA